MGLKAEIEALYRTTKTAGKGHLVFEEHKGGFVEISIVMGRVGKRPVCKVSRIDLARIGLFFGLGDEV